MLIGSHCQAAHHGRLGFGEPRTAMAGLNRQTQRSDRIARPLTPPGLRHITQYRAQLANRYRAMLPELEFQRQAPGIQAYQFVPGLIAS